MPISVKGLFDLSVSFDGFDYPLAPNTIVSVEIIENIKNNLPTFHFHFSDATGYLIQEKAISDGTIAKVKMENKSTGYNNSMDFRMFSLEAGPIGNTSMVKGYGYLNHPKYMRKIAKGAYKGNSNNAISKLAGEAGLKSVVDSFSDALTWLPVHDYIVDFVNKVAYHGHAGDKSITSVGVDTKSRLHYRDLSKVIKESPKKRLVYGPESSGGITVLEYNIKNYGGALNTSGGYNASTIQLNMDGVMKTFDSIKVPMMSSFLNMGKGVADLFGPTKINYNPIDSGNVHKNYSKAEHTNRRGRATFGLNIYVLTDKVTDLNIYDMVDLELWNETEPKRRNDVYSGKYMVSAKTMIIRGGGKGGNKYYEKLELSSQGPNSNPGGNLAG